MESGDQALAAQEIRIALQASKSAAASDFPAKAAPAAVIANADAAASENTMLNIGTLKTALKTIIHRLSDSTYRPQMASMLDLHQALFNSLKTFKTSQWTESQAQKTESELASLILKLKSIDAPPPDTVSASAASTLTAASSSAEKEGSSGVVQIDGPFQAAVDRLFFAIGQMKAAPKLRPMVLNLLKPHSNYLHRLSEIKRGHAHADNTDVTQVKALTHELLEIAPQEEAAAKSDLEESVDEMSPGTPNIGSNVDTWNDILLG